MTTLTALADALAAEYDIDRAAALDAIETYAGQLQDEDLYDTEAGMLTDAGEAVIREQFAADYSDATTPAAQQHDELLAGIREAADEIDELQRKLSEAMHRRDEMIRSAIRKGVRVPAIADAAGLDRQRVYQIRDQRR